MDDWKNKIKSNPHIALSVPTILCALTFATNLVAALKDGVIDDVEFHQLLSSADGFETVLLVIIMFVLRSKKR